MGNDLLDLSARYSLYSWVFGETAAEQFPEDPVMQIHEGRVMVEIAASDMDLLLAELEGHDFITTASYGVMVSGSLPIEALADLADSEATQFIRPLYRPVAQQQGQIGNQGNIALRADIAQTEFNVTGAGVTIGVLSDSFDNLGGAQADRLSGDLPEVNVLLDLPGGGSDEGRAMLQLIADIAPGADLAFHTAFLGQAGFAQGILDLAAAGAD